MKAIDKNQSKLENLGKQGEFSAFNTSCMRGVAILLVVLCHMAGTFFEGSLYWPFHDWNFLAFFKDINILRPLYQN